MSSPKTPKILVVGAGGIGGTVCGYLSEVGTDVVASTTNQSIYDAVSAQGFGLSGDGNPRQIRGRICLGVPENERFDYILLATQPPQVEAAAREAAPLLAEDGRMVVFQNGLCEERIALICGSDRVIGGIIAWGASMSSPGNYDRTSSGGFQIGTLSGLHDEKLRELASLLEIVGPVTQTGNLLGARWSKLALNCCISSIGTLGGDRLGVLAKVRRYRRLGLEIFAETVAVAKAENVRLEKVSGTLDLNWIAITDKERKSPGSPNLAAKHAMLLAVGMRYRRLRSSMLSALERGRPSSIDFLNGEVEARGKVHGIATPVNALITETVHAIARGEKRSSRETLDEVFAATR
ncbi:MAG: ketopantoate reductase family protein [Myxococcales bacterium]|nr:ketopantoate reductase family protein [Myxococcales bacterium]